METEDFTPDWYMYDLRLTFMAAELCKENDKLLKIISNNKYRYELKTLD